MKYETPNPSSQNQLKDINYRCPFCGKDVEQKVPTTVTVNADIIKKIMEIDGDARIVSTEMHNKWLSLELDDFTLKPLHGECHQINIDLCRTCIAKLAFRHKFARTQKLKSYATSRV